MKRGWAGWIRSGVGRPGYHAPATATITEEGQLGVGRWVGPWVGDHGLLLLCLIDVLVVYL